MIDTPRFSRATVLQAVSSALTGAIPPGWAGLTVLAERLPDGKMNLAMITNVPNDERARRTMLLAVLRKEFEAPDDISDATFAQLLADAYKESRP